MPPNTYMTNADGVNNTLTIVQFYPMNQLTVKQTESQNFSLGKDKVSMLTGGPILYGVSIDPSLT